MCNYFRAMNEDFGNNTENKEMNEALCDTCYESKASISEGTELFCSTCYVKKLKEEGDYNEDDFWE